MSTEISLDLYNVSDADELKKLLCSGSNINERNSFEETPLLCAVRCEKDIQLLEEFLNHGADVNIPDCWGITPLYSALTKHWANLKVIELLLENGADIKGGNPVNDRALDYVIMHRRLCAKMLIKYKFLKNFRFVKNFKKVLRIAHENDSKIVRNYYLEYKEVVDLNIKPSCYDAFSSFLDKCASDVLRMQRALLCNGNSLLEFVKTKNSFENLDTETAKQITFQICEELNSKEYFVYKSMVASRIGRRYLLSKIEEQLIFRDLDKSLNQHIKSIFLNSDLMYNVSKYLSDEDLLNILIAHLFLSVQINA